MQSERVAIDQIRALHKQAETLSQRLKLAEENRKTVRESVYQRVTEGYKRQLDALLAELKPLRAHVDSRLREIQDQMQRVRGEADLTDQEAEEARFRHLCGEYDDHKFQSLDAEFSGRREKTRADLAGMEAELSGLQELGGLAAQPAGAAPAGPVSPPKPAAAAAPPEAATIAPPEPAESVILMEEADATPPPPAEAPAGLDWVDPFAESGQAKDAADGSTPAPADSILGLEADLVLEGTSEPEIELSGGNPTLVLIQDGKKVRNYPLHAEVTTIGGHPDNDLHFPDDKAIARFHATIIAGDTGYLLTDLKSLSGTQVNGQKVREWQLVENDLITVGGVQLLFTSNP